MNNYLELGKWNVVCDRCGFHFKNDQLRKEWTGLMVCHKCWEPRHPQDLIKVPREEIAPPWTRPEPEDEFIQICYIWAMAAYADLGTADCMQADLASPSYQTLLNLYQGT